MWKLTLKQSLNYLQVTNPSTAILGISNVLEHVIKGNNKTRHHISTLIQLRQ
jgi:P pilus assembly chaperone PapD